MFSLLFILTSTFVTARQDTNFYIISAPNFCPEDAYVRLIAPSDAGTNVYPLLSFAHGRGVDPRENYNGPFFSLVDAGYVVASFAGCTESSAEQQKTQILELMLNEFKNWIDWSIPVGLFGHSMGGQKTHLNSYDESFVTSYNIGAALGFESYIQQSEFGQSLVPTAFISGQYDSVTPPSWVYDLFEYTSNIDRFFWEGKGEGHWYCAENTECGIQDKIAAFFDCYIKQESCTAVVSEEVCSVVGTELSRCEFQIGNDEYFTDNGAGEDSESEDTSRTWNQYITGDETRTLDEHESQIGGEFGESVTRTENVDLIFVDENVFERTGNGYWIQIDESFEENGTQIGEYFEEDDIRNTDEDTSRTWDESITRSGNETGNIDEDWREFLNETWTRDEDETGSIGEDWREFLNETWTRDEDETQTWTEEVEFGTSCLELETYEEQIRCLKAEVQSLGNEVLRLETQVESFNDIQGTCAARCSSIFADIAAIVESHSCT